MSCETIPSTDSRTLRITQLYLMFLFTWQAFFKVSDVGMNVLLAFIATFLAFLLRMFGASMLQGIVQQLPKTVYLARKYLGVHKDRFIKYASCPRCHSIYSIESCKVVLPNGSPMSSKCSHVEFPNHPQRVRRSPCNSVLLKTVRTSCGTSSLYPRQMYCYKSVTESLQELILRPGFVEICENWRTRNIANDMITDIYDGKVWKDFLNPNGVPFLSLPFNFALTLNIDWFQPFRNTVYATGAIYLSIMNLPRNERYANGNVILVGIIPGPHEPSKTMNSYLKPLVDELKELWEGVIMQSISKTQVIVRAALLCTACDIPAARKVSGFVGHNAVRACSRCLKQFPTASFGEKPDYTGFDRTAWPKRSEELHRKHSMEHRKCKTAQARKDIEREYGCRYSILLELPYYNVIRMCVVDPMHNLLLGTAKHILNLWKSHGILDSKCFESIQKKIDSFVTPGDVGRIPSRIQSGFAGFTADQWRNWTLLYSLCCLKEFLPHRDYNCWLAFVKACTLLCRRSITIQQLDEADALLLNFCQMFEQLYGNDGCTINIHLHGHLKECIVDFGPVYAFWLFSFERMNGVLGSYHTNCHDISLQLMRRFVANLDCNRSNWPEEYEREFSPLIFNCPYNKGSLMSETLELSLNKNNSGAGVIKPLPPVCELAWPTYQKEALHPIATEFVGHSDFTILTLFHKCKALSLGEFVIGSCKSRYPTSSRVMAKHPNNHSIHLARIEFFAKVDIKLVTGEETNLNFWIAAVSFYFQHEYKVWFGYPTEVWALSTLPDLFFIPINYIVSRVAYCELEVNFGHLVGNQRVMVVSPISSD